MSSSTISEQQQQQDHQQEQVQRQQEQPLRQKLTPPLTHHSLNLHHHHHHHKTTPFAMHPSRPASLLLALVLLTSLLALSSSASIPEYLQEKVKEHLSREVSAHGECDTDMQVSAVCYHCASLNTIDFQAVHMRCCEEPGRVREFCISIFTTDPKRGGSNVWYY